MKCLQQGHAVTKQRNWSVLGGVPAGLCCVSGRFVEEGGSAAFLLMIQ